MKNILHYATMVFCLTSNFTFAMDNFFSYKADVKTVDGDPTININFNWKSPVKFRYNKITQGSLIYNSNKNNGNLVLRNNKRWPFLSYFDINLIGKEKEMNTFIDSFHSFTNSTVSRNNASYKTIKTLIENVSKDTIDDANNVTSNKTYYFRYMLGGMGIISVLGIGYFTYKHCYVK